MSSKFYKISSIIAIVWIFLFASEAFGSELYINQSGNNFELDVRQDGTGNNLIRGYLSTTLYISQGHRNYRNTHIQGLISY